MSITSPEPDTSGCGRSAHSCELGTRRQACQAFVSEWACTAVAAPQGAAVLHLQEGEPGKAADAAEGTVVEGVAAQDDEALQGGPPAGAQLLE